MSIVRIRPPGEGNDLYPLPPDYLSLTSDGQRQARVNASRQWLITTDDLAERARAFVASLNFFDLYYLWPDHDDGFDSYFYDDAPLPTPNMHWDIASFWAQHRLTLSIAPRGGAKSSLIRKACLLRLVTRPSYSIVYATSTNDLAEATGEMIKFQAYNNQRLNDDFGPEPEFGGRIQPHRHEARQSTKFFYLRNRAVFQCLSAQSKQRGIRPRRYVLDDPEHDPKASTPMPVLRAYMDTLIGKIVIPTVLRGGTDIGCDWVGTFVSKRHYAWYAFNVKPTEDPRFAMWARMMIKAADTDPKTGKLLSFWPELHPATISDRETIAKVDPTYANKVSLEEIRQMIGDANFKSEYLCEPGDPENQYFGALDQPSLQYTLTDVDAAFSTNVFDSAAKINWLCNGEPRTELLADLLRRSRTFITVDTSFTNRADSDFKAATLMAYTREKELFVLDIWCKQTREEALIRAIFKMADRWKCPHVYVEVVKQSRALYEALDHIGRTDGARAFGVSYVPIIRPLRVGVEDKTSKISSLHFRFEKGLIKLPHSLRFRKPWAYLFDQIEGFNPDAPDGGLDHDDALDTVAMSQFVLKTRQTRGPLEPEEEEPTDPLELLLSGKRFNKSGDAVALAIDWTKVPVSTFMKALNACHTQPNTPKLPPAYGGPC